MATPVTGVIALGIGLFVRSSAAGIAASVGLLLVVPSEAGGVLVAGCVLVKRRDA